MAPAVMTPQAKRMNLKDDDDNSLDKHGTCTAGKALGQQYGAAKKATLVPVILAWETTSELVSAFEQISIDLEKNPERKGFSVVTLSLTANQPAGRYGVLLIRALQNVMRMDVPIVVCAGNEAEKPGRENIDQYSAVFALRGIDIIVVGAATRQGQKSVFSQGGDALTLYAVGEGITCLGASPVWMVAPAHQSLTSPVPLFVSLTMLRTPCCAIILFDTHATNSGTSLATPMVAGQIAILLSYDNPPFDKSPGKVVSNVKKYMKSHPDAGWARVEDIRMLYNGKIRVWPTLQRCDAEKSKGVPGRQEPKVQELCWPGFEQVYQQGLCQA